MSGEARYAPVRGGCGEPIDLDATDVLDDEHAAAERAREASDATGEQYRVVKIIELDLIKPRRLR